MESVIGRLLHSDVAWRYVDAYFPRLSGLIFHTYLIKQHGGELYALPGWILSTLALCMAFVPDPHSYILVRARGSRAQRLLGLTMPCLVLKAAACTAIAAMALLTLPTAHMTAEHGPMWPIVFSAVAVYGSVELLWAGLGTASLVTGQIRKVARLGAMARLAALVLIPITCWGLGTSSMVRDFLLATAPVFLAWLFISPWRGSLRRSWHFFIFSLRAYAGWNQGIALTANTMFQLPLLVLGVHSAVGAATVGQMAYIARLLQAALQPFQILQSVVIMNAAQAARGVVRSDSSQLQWVFRLGSVVIMIIGGVLLAVFSRSIGLAWESCMLALAMVTGVAVSVWHRYELAKMLATSGLKRLFVFGYLPVVTVTALLAVLSMRVVGMIGLAIVTVLGWICLSVSWKWSR